MLNRIKNNKNILVIIKLTRVPDLYHGHQFFTVLVNDHVKSKRLSYNNNETYLQQR